MRVMHVGLGFRPLRWGGLIGYAEDLMAAQVAHGDRVSYFFRGRSYPFMAATRLKRWERDGVSMNEVVNSTLPIGGGQGTLRPDLECEHPPTERAFADALAAQRPDVVHVQELLGLPSSLVDVAQDRGVPVVITLEDYYALCPTMRLWDADGNVCLRREPGEMCAVCCRDAPVDSQGLVDATMLYEQVRALEAIPGVKHIPRPQPLVRAVRGAGGWTQEAWRSRRRGAAGEGPDVARGTVAPAEPRTPPPAAYDRRRATFVERLGRADLVVAMSHRVAEIATGLGVSDERLEVLQLTLAHIDGIAPRRMEPVRGPVHFATLAGCAFPEKGVHVMLGAMQRLRERGYGERDLVLHVKGAVDPLVRDALEAEPSVSLEGVYGPDEMNRLLPRWHVGIVPSIWEEAYGYVGVEFLAAGIPVIGNAIGGIPDYCVDGETGWLNRDRSADGLARIMASIVEDPGQVTALNERILARRAQLIKPMDRHVLEMAERYTRVSEARASA